MEEKKGKTQTDVKEKANEREAEKKTETNSTEKEETEEKKETELPKEQPKKVPTEKKTKAEGAKGTKPTEEKATKMQAEGTAAPAEDEVGGSDAAKANLEVPKKEPNAKNAVAQAETVPTFTTAPTATADSKNGQAEGSSHQQHHRGRLLMVRSENGQGTKLYNEG